MKDEYDFSQGVRGKFYRDGVKVTLPVYLDDEVQSYLARRAAERGVELSELVNDLLRKDIELIESAK
ncbi:MAG TPA: hypothetical protein VHP37_24165 [Burkholderiales bacterium]|nr:hypothetical protein [Burkholderiales bacterium]